jgi:hypothetical protein
MNLFNINDPNHIRILKEEIRRAKRIIAETYSADAVWGKMTADDRKTELYSAKAMNPDELVNTTWDSIPADTQDQIDLSKYSLANMPGGSGNMSGLRAIKRFATEDGNVKQLVDKYLAKVGRSLSDITVTQSYDLQTMIGKLRQQTSSPTKSSIELNPRDFGGGPSTNPYNKGYTGD